MSVDGVATLHKSAWNAEHMQAARQRVKKAFARRMGRLVVPFSICLTRLQISFAFLNIDFGWPPWFIQVIRWMVGFIRFDVSALAPAYCAFEFDSPEQSYLAALAAKMSLFPALCIAICVYHAIRWLGWSFSKLRNRGKDHHISPVNTMLAA